MRIIIISLICAVLNQTDATNTPTRVPSVVPTVTPTKVPTTSPIILNGSSPLIIFERANFGSSWRGVSLTIESSASAPLYDAAPSAGNNPFTAEFRTDRNAASSALFFVSAMFPAAVPADADERDLKCVVSFFGLFIEWMPQCVLSMIDNICKKEDAWFSRMLVSDYLCYHLLHHLFMTSRLIFNF